MAIVERQFIVPGIEEIAFDTDDEAIQVTAVVFTAASEIDVEALDGKARCARRQQGDERVTRLGGEERVVDAEVSG